MVIPVESCTSARITSGGVFAIETGAIWILLLPADNWDMMVHIIGIWEDGMMKGWMDGWMDR